MDEMAAQMHACWYLMDEMDTHRCKWYRYYPFVLNNPFVFKFDPSKNIDVGFDSVPNTRVYHLTAARTVRDARLD
jgi:hypothetical protein